MQNMLEHQIVVLENVMGNVDLFKKELKKSTKWLNENELALLKNYIFNRYENPYREIMFDVFKEKTLS